MDRKFETQGPISGETEACIFAAELQPHTSLSRRGFVLLMSLVAAVGFIAGMLFMISGAWPITGFFGLDVALIWYAFRANYRWAKTRETVHLTRNCLTVERINPSGKVRRWQLQPYWLRVEVDSRETNPRAVKLSSHGRTLTIGSFLAPEERLDLARALEEALSRVRLPDHLARAT